MRIALFGRQERVCSIVYLLDESERKNRSNSHGIAIAGIFIASRGAFIGFHERRCAEGG